MVADLRLSVLNRDLHRAQWWLWALWLSVCTINYHHIDVCCVCVALRQAALISENGFLSSRYDVADIKRTWMNASRHRQTGRQQKREKRQADWEKETGGRMDVETGTDRQTCKLTDKQSVTSRHAWWWMIDINPEHFDSEYHSWSEKFQKDDRAYRGCFDSPSYTPVVNISLALVAAWRLLCWKKWGSAHRQLGPEASPVRISHTANKPVKWQQSSRSTSRQKKSICFTLEMEAELWMSPVWNWRYSEWLAWLRVNAEWLWCGITIIQNNSASLDDCSTKKKRTETK